MRTAFKAWPPYRYMKQPYTNVSIINNHVDAGTKTKSPMQGLSAFDGKWANVVIKGNYVRPRAYPRHYLVGRHRNCYRRATPSISFAMPVVIRLFIIPSLPPPWINVSSAKDKTPSTDLTIGQNITPRYVRR